MAVNPEYRYSAPVLAPEVPPADTPAPLSDYLVRLQQRIGDALRNTQQLEQLGRLPDKPTIGRLYYFTGAILPTITSEGAYVYTSSGWAKL